jgi:hypothetical protein
MAVLMSKLLVLIVFLASCAPEATGLKSGKYLVSFQSFQGACIDGERWGSEDAVEQWVLTNNQDIWRADFDDNTMLNGVFSADQLSFATQGFADDGSGCEYPFSITYTVSYYAPNMFRGIMTNTYSPCNNDNLCVLQANLTGTPIH